MVKRQTLGYLYKQTNSPDGPSFFFFINNHLESTTKAVQRITSHSTQNKTHYKQQTTKTFPSKCLQWISKVSTNNQLQFKSWTEANLLHQQRPKSVRANKPSPTPPPSSQPGPPRPRSPTPVLSHGRSFLARRPSPLVMVRTRSIFSRVVRLSLVPSSWDLWLLKSRKGEG